MVYRIYVEKIGEFAVESKALEGDIKNLLGIGELESLRIINRYDVENIDSELFERAVGTVFSEPQIDVTGKELSDFTGGDDSLTVFATEYLPGQFDQRADSAAQCIQIISQGERPVVRTAKIYILKAKKANSGKIAPESLEKIKKYVINPVEAREASLEMPETLEVKYSVPESVETLEGFTSKDEKALAEFIKDRGLAMDLDDIKMVRDYFAGEHREPTITEIKVLDTYWSDHCRHTTFGTVIDGVRFKDMHLQSAYEDYIAVRKELGRDKPICLMDLGTIAAKYLRANGELDKLDQSEEINACTVRVDVETEGRTEPWLLLFKNETHNHPTEIEPFGGAATCVGGAIRDPLSGRAYVYGAMRVTGAADPLTPIENTIEGKLPQRKIVTTAAAGYSSYGNQIGLATGIVDEIYHPGYAAKRMEIGAVIAAAPAENVRRERPAAGDKVILLGGSTGRDGIGGATGASKAHNIHSVETCGAEVQKGNAPEERKLQRLFRNGEATRLIKRCNDFGAGGVSVAIGELADGLLIDLDRVPKKYEGLDGTELAISESQERMAVVVAAEDAEKFMKLAAAENLQAVVVATVQEEPRLVLTWRGEKIVDLSRAFLDTNGAPKHIYVDTEPGDSSVCGGSLIDTAKITTLAEGMKEVAGNLNTCSKQGLSERFDSTIGAGSVLMPFGGVNQITPAQAMVQKLPVMGGKTKTCSLMSFGYNPFITEASPFHGAYLAVVESVSKLIACGASFEDVYLTFQEYFEKLGRDSKRWGQPFAALLGAFKAQMDLRIAAIGGKDSMSGSFEDLDVPPTLVSFAVTTGSVDKIISPEFKAAGHPVLLIKPEIGINGLPTRKSLLEAFDIINEMVNSGRAVSCYTLGMGGVAEAIMKMCFGNNLGFAFKSRFNNNIKELFSYNYGAFVVELSGNIRIQNILNRRSGMDRRGPERAELGRRSGNERRKELHCSVIELGNVTAEPTIVYGSDAVSLSELLAAYKNTLESVYPTKPADGQKENSAAKTFARSKSTNSVAKSANVKIAKPHVLIPAFPGTNCEWDSAAAIERAGGEAEILVINNLSPAGISDSIERFAKSLAKSQMVFIPGGFSGGDEPDGSAKFIAAFFRNARIRDGVTELLEQRDGLMCGICNGFQALIKLGLVPYGKIMDTDASCPTLTFNKIGRHQSRIVRTRIVSNRSPWLSLTNETDIYSVPISHGEGRFIASPELVKELFASGRVATQYVDLEGKPSDDVRYNPNGSICAIEGILSPDGRVFGKMGHAERIGEGLYKNVPGNYDMKMFESAVKYFK